MFIDVLAHELMTPLKPIPVSTGMLNEMMDGDANDVRRRLVSNIMKSS
jgi:hypothetical protein